VAMWLFEASVTTLCHKKRPTFDLL